MLFGAERVVLYLEPPVQTLASIDGSRESAIRQAIEKFLSSPDSTFDKSVDANLHQVRDLNTNTRAFATWCQDEDSKRELCVVHTIYRKRNEADYFAHTNTYSEDGKEYKTRFKGLSDEEYQNWLESMKEQDGLIVVLSED